MAYTGIHIPSVGTHACCIRCHRVNQFDEKEKELQAYHESIEQYEKDIALWKEAQEQAKIDEANFDLNQRIEKTKRRLANLEAQRDGKDLPFPISS